MALNSGRQAAPHVLLGSALTAQTVAAHLVLPLVPVVKGLPFLTLVALRPTGTTLLVGGAHARSGGLPWPALFAVAVFAAVATDVLSFTAGRWWGSAALRRFGHGHGRRAVTVVERVQPFVQRRGALVVLLARPSLVTHGTVPVLAGVSGLRWRAFLPACLVGAVAWASMWLAAGAALGSFVERYAGPVLWSVTGVIVLGAATWWVACRIGWRTSRHCHHQPATT